MNPLASGAVTLLVATLAAQAPPADGHLPAGTCSVADLLARAEQALGLRIVADPGEVAAASAEPLRLQFPVTLDAAYGREAACALLSTRGLLLVERAAGHCEVKAARSVAPSWLRDVAVDSTARELLDFPHRHAVVRLELPCSVPAELLHTQLSAAAAPSASVPIVEPGRAGIVLTGAADAVRCAVAMAAAQDADLAAVFTAPEPSIPILSSARGGTVELAAGPHSLPHLVDLLAANAGIVVVASPAVAAATTKVVVPTKQQLTWERGSTALLQLLWRHRVQLLELDVRHALYEAVLVPDAGHAPGTARASRRSADAVAAIAEVPLYIGVPFAAPDHDEGQRLARARLAMAGRDADDTLLAVCSTPDGLWITGLAPAVADLLAALQPLR